MPLQRTDTGEMSKPLQELRERNDLTKEQYDTALLKEALATSNERCNILIERQNTLVEAIPRQIMRTETHLEQKVDRAVRQMEQESLQANQIKTEIKQTIKSEITTSVCDMKGYVKNKIDESLSEVKSQLSATAKEIEKQREEYKLQGIFRKIFELSVKKGWSLREIIR